MLPSLHNEATDGEQGLSRDDERTDRVDEERAESWPEANVLKIIAPHKSFPLGLPPKKAGECLSGRQAASGLLPQI